MMVSAIILYITELGAVPLAMSPRCLTRSSLRLPDIKIILSSFEETLARNLTNKSCYINVERLETAEKKSLKSTVLGAFLQASSVKSINNVFDNLCCR